MASNTAAEGQPQTLSDRQISRRRFLGWLTAGGAAATLGGGIALYDMFFGSGPRPTSGQENGPESTPLPTSISTQDITPTYVATNTPEILASGVPPENPPLFTSQELLAIPDTNMATADRYSALALHARFAGDELTAPSGDQLMHLLDQYAEDNNLRVVQTWNGREGRDSRAATIVIQTLEDGTETVDWASDDRGNLGFNPNVSPTRDQYRLAQIQVPRGYHVGFQWNSEDNNIYMFGIPNGRPYGEYWFDPKPPANRRDARSLSEAWERLIPTNVMVDIQEGNGANGIGYTPQQQICLWNGLVAQHRLMTRWGQTEAEQEPVRLYIGNDARTLARRLQGLEPTRNRWAWDSFATGHGGGHLYDSVDQAAVGVVWTGQPGGLPWDTDAFWSASLASMYTELVWTNLASDAGINIYQWLYQGGHRWTSWQAAQEAGFDTAGLRADAFAEARRMRGRETLSNTGNGVIDLGAMGFEYLVTSNPRGYATVLDFFRNIGQGMTQENAFERAFGSRFSEFQTRFEEYRSVRSPSTGVMVGRVYGPDGQPLNNSRVQQPTDMRNVWIWAVPADTGNVIPEIPPPPTAQYEPMPSPTFPYYYGFINVPVRPENVRIIVTRDATLAEDSIIGYGRVVDDASRLYDRSLGETYTMAVEVVPSENQASILTVGSGSNLRVDMNSQMVALAPTPMAPVDANR